MSKSKNHSNRTNSKRASNNTKGKIINSYGYDVSQFNVLDIPVRRESKTGRLISTSGNRQKDHLNES